MKFSNAILFCLLFTIGACNSAEESSQEKSSDDQELDLNIPIEEMVPEETIIDSSFQNENTIVEDEVHESSDQNSIKKDAPKVDSKSEEMPENTSTSEEAGTINKGEFIRDKGIKLNGDYKFDLATFAIEDVNLNKAGECGPNCGKNVVVVNANSTRVIEVAVQVQWKIAKEKSKKVFLYQIQSGSEKIIGCTLNCSEEEIAIKWKIISAKYMD